MEKYIDFLLGGIVKGTKNADALFSGTYVLGIVFSIIMLLIAALIAKSIYSVPDGSDITKRKRWFWGLSAVAPILFSLYNYFFIINNIKGLVEILNEESENNPEILKMLEDSTENLESKIKNTLNSIQRMQENKKETKNLSFYKVFSSVKKSLLLLIKQNKNI